jgi:hypothetical protein
VGETVANFGTVLGAVTLAVATACDTGDSSNFAMAAVLSHRIRSSRCGPVARRGARRWW